MALSPLHGKGLWMRRIAACENGNLTAIVARARAAGLTHVILKIADGADPYNLDLAAQSDTAADLTRRLSAAGIAVWGWQDVYGDRPRFKGTPQSNYHLLEAERANQRVALLRDVGLQGYILSADSDYERLPQRARQADEFMRAIRAALPGFPIGLSAWKYPATHARFPWAEFRQHCDLDLPQVFWIGKRREAVEQLEKSLAQYRALEPKRPFIPVGPAFSENNWRPTPEALREFLERAQALGLPAASLWAWDFIGLTGDEPSGNPDRLDFLAHWQALAEAGWKDEALEEAPHMMAATEDGGQAMEDIAAELEALKADETEAALPEWMSAPDTELSEAGAEPVRPFAPEETSEDEGRTPEEAPHIMEATDDGGQATEDIAAELEALKANETEAALPEWMSAPDTELSEADAEPVRPFAPEETTEDKGREAEEAPHIFGEATDDGGQATNDIAAELGALKADETEAALPEWMTTPDTELSEADAEPVRPFGPEETIEDEGGTPEEAPHTMTAMEDDRQATEDIAAELEALKADKTEAALPEWMSAPEVELTLADAEPVRPYAPEETTEDEGRTTEVITAQEGRRSIAFPEWLRMPIEDVAEAVVEPIWPAIPEPPVIPESPVAPEATAMPAADGIQIAPSPVSAHSPAISQLFDDLRVGRLQEALSLYGPTAVLAGLGQTAHDVLGVRRFYLGLLPKLDRSSLILEEVAVHRQTVTATWACRTRTGEARQGTDTFHLDEHDLIIYHHTTLHPSSGSSP